MVSERTPSTQLWKLAPRDEHFDRAGPSGLAGLLRRKQYPEIPPRVEYSLTPKGEALVPVMNAICRWASKADPA